MGKEERLDRWRKAMSYHLKNIEDLKKKRLINIFEAQRMTNTIFHLSKDVTLIVTDTKEEKGNGYTQTAYELNEYWKHRRKRK